MAEQEAYRLLVIDDKASMRELLDAAFTERGYAVTTASNGDDGIEKLAGAAFDVVITDMRMPGKDGIDVLRASKQQHPDTPVLIITAFGTIETAVEAMRLGASDFIAKPFPLDEMERKVDRLVRRKLAESRGTPQTWMHPSIQQMVGGSMHTKQLMKMIAKIAPSKSSVLITGPSGVGKELVARAIHDASPRRDRPFVALNCAALAPGVLESELFGHEKGSFTGAAARRAGRFEKAHSGTLFLDEVGEIDGAIQTKLLRVLQEGEIERVGGTETVKVDVRIVAATNRDLREAIRQGLFREDFYYRLNVFSIKVEPLRNRRDDIPALVDHFMRKFSVEMEKEVTEVEDDVMEVFLRYAWPGNVREMENIIERAVVLAEDQRITRRDLPPEIFDARPLTGPYTDFGPPLATAYNEAASAPAPAAPARFGEASSLTERKDRLESDLIKGALERFRWNKTKAAEHLGLKRTTLQYKIKKYGLE